MPMPKMIPHDYFINFVEENFDEWQKEPASIRKAFNVAVPAFHLADNYFLRHNKEFAKRYREIEQFRAALSRRTRYFRTIQGMATAYKHLYTHVSCEVMSGGAIAAVTFGKETINSRFEEINNEPVSWIEIQCRDGSVVKFDTAIEEVVGMWRKIICSDNEPAL